MELQQAVRRIEEEFEYDPQVDEDAVRVEIADGRLVLKGHVDRFLDRVTAEHSAQRVCGETLLINEIEVHRPAGEQVNDDEIAARLEALIRWRDDLPAEDVVVHVDQGIVTLSGEVDWQFQREEIEDIVAQSSRVFDIRNQIQLRRRPVDRDVQDNIKRAFARSASDELNRIEIDTDGGKVTLTGTVLSPHERHLARKAVWSIPGVHCVVDNLTVP